MYEDEHLEMDYEDRYTIQGDIASEDESYYDNSDNYYEASLSDLSDESDNDDETERAIARHEMDVITDNPLYDDIPDKPHYKGRHANEDEWQKTGQHYDSPSLQDTWGEWPSYGN